MTAEYVARDITRGEVREVLDRLYAKEPEDPTYRATSHDTTIEVSNLVSLRVTVAPLDEGDFFL